MKVKEFLIKKEIEAILVTNILNVRYMTGFTGTTALALVLKDKRYLITDFRYKSQATKEIERYGFELICENIDSVAKVGEILKENGVKRLGIEKKNITLESFERFKVVFENIEFVGADEFFLEEREVKTEEEIAIIRKSIQIAEEALKKVIPTIKIGMREIEIANELEYEMRKLGASKSSFDIIVASNERSALPHGVASEKRVEEGFLTIDYGCFYKGYASDITRTFYVGEGITEKHREIYNIVKEANELAIKSVKAGIETQELDKIARDYIESKGYGEYFGHGLGHGFGLEIHEEPYVSFKAKNKVLKPGMIITIEPGIYLEGFGGVRIEDDILVTETGYEVLTTLEKELKIIK